MKKFLLSCSLILLLGLLSFVSAQSANRVHFKKGATSVVLTGNLNNYRSGRIFVMRLRAGQTINTEQLKSDNSLHYVSVYISDPKGKDAGDYAADCHSRREISPTVAGDYKINVVECQKADAWRGNFRVKVSVK